MSIKYSLLIPSNARPYCLERLLNSIRYLTPSPIEIIIGNSTPNDTPIWVKSWYEAISNKPNIRIIRLQENQGPASSRHDLIKNCSTEYAMLLDDDIVLTESSNNLIANISTCGYDILGGVWLQNKKSDYSNLITLEEANECCKYDGKPYDQKTIRIGFTYSFSEPGNGERCVIKTPVFCPVSFDGVMQIDDLIPVIIAPTRIFNSISFDPQFEYFFDWYDFFMQMKVSKFRCAVDTGARFIHIPEKYSTFTAAKLSPRKYDKERFVEKWKIHPLFSGETQY